MSLASLSWTFLSRLPVEELNFFWKIGLEGSGVERGGLGYADFIHVAKCVFEYLVDERVDGNFDVVSCLVEVDTIIHIEVALAFDRYCKFVVDHVQKYISSSLSVGGGNSEVIDMTHEEDTLTVDGARIQVWFVLGWGMSDFA
jgi:hypothetical protein